MVRCGTPSPHGSTGPMSTAQVGSRAGKGPDSETGTSDVTLFAGTAVTPSTGAAPGSAVSTPAPGDSVSRSAVSVESRPSVNSYVYSNSKLERIFF